MKTTAEITSLLRFLKYQEGSRTFFLSFNSNDDIFSHANASTVANEVLCDDSFSKSNSAQTVMSRTLMKNELTPPLLCRCSIIIKTILGTVRSSQQLLYQGNKKQIILFESFRFLGQRFFCFDCTTASPISYPPHLAYLLYRTCSNCSRNRAYISYCQYSTVFKFKENTIRVSVS